MVSEDEQQLAELHPLSIGEADEQLVLGLALRGCGGVELAFAGRGEVHDMAAAVGGITVAGEVAGSLEGVEQGHQNARVHVHGAPELTLGQRAPVVQQPEQVKLAGGDAGSGVGGAETAHRVLAEQGEQQPSAAGALAKDTLAVGVRPIGGRSRHADSLYAA